MSRPFLALLALLIAAQFVPQQADAFLWGLFGKKEEWRRMEPAKQNELAAPIMQKALSDEAAGKMGSAVKAYKKIYNDYPGSQYAAEAMYRRAGYKMDRKDWRGALNLYRRLVANYPESPYFNDVIANMFKIAEAFETGDNLRMFYIFPYKDGKQAILTYESLIATAPYSDYAPISLMRIALVYKRKGNEIGTIDALDRLVNNYPESMLAPDANLLMADTFASETNSPYYDQGSTREAMSYYRDFMVLFPDNPSVKEAEKGLTDSREIYAASKLVLGEFFYKARDDYAAAEVFFNDAITIAPESHAASEARDYLAVIEQIKAAYPNNDWPRRNAWQHAMFWSRFDPLDLLPKGSRNAAMSTSAEPAQ